MVKCLLSYSVLFVLSCSAPNQKSKVDRENSILNSTSIVNGVGDTLQTPLEGDSKPASITTKKDTLSAIESNFFSMIAKENEFILLSKEIERTFSVDGNLLVSKMLFSKSTLVDGGYINIDVSIYGNITDRISVQYSYNMGQASYGYGSVMGDDINSYLHTIKSCGISSCIIQVFDTGRKIFETENAN